MADKTAPAEGSVPNLHRDEVTGEMVSKSELKKRQKKREADAKKVCFLLSFPLLLLGLLTEWMYRRPRRPLLPHRGRSPLRRRTRSSRRS